MHLAYIVGRLSEKVLVGSAGGCYQPGETPGERGRQMPMRGGNIRRQDYPGGPTRNRSGVGIEGPVGFLKNQATGCPARD